MTRSEVWCTNCSRQFIATLDLTLNGNHEITCPHCGHIHYRVVQDGVVTDDRWQSSAGQTYIATTSTTIAVNFTMTTGTFVMDSWLGRSDLDLAT